MGEEGADTPAERVRPRWSLRTSFFFLLAAAAFTTLVTLVVAQRSIWIELEIATALVSLFLFGYFAVLLYLGIHVEEGNRLRFGWRALDLEWFDAFGPGLPGLHMDAGIVGCLAGLLFETVLLVLLSLVVATVVWLSFNLFLETLVVVCLPLYVLFRRSVRVALARSARCHGRIGPSLGWAAVSTATSAVWLYLVLFTGHAIALRLGTV